MRTHRQASKQLSERQRRIFDFLDQTRVGVLTSVDPNGDPHGSVIYFTVEKDFCTYFITKKQTKKSDNLSRNNHVMLVVFEPSSQTVAQVIGKVKLIKDSDTINKIADSVFAASIHIREGVVPPITKLEAGEYIGFEIRPDYIRMATYVQSNSDEYAKIFESIESFELKI